MPIYEYVCAKGHRTERIRSFADRDATTMCCVCNLTTARVEISAAHCLPDGMYSYAPNVGSEASFERKREAMKNGEKVYRKEIPASDG